MTFFAANAGEAFLLEAAVGKTAIVTGFKLKLFKSNTVITRATLLGDLTEADFSGYTAGGISLAVATWGSASAGTGSGVSLSEKASIAYPQQTFSHSGGATANDVYGYYITNNAGTVLIGAELFPALKTMAASGDSIKVTPVMTLSSE